MLQGAAALAASSVLPGCGSSSATGATGAVTNAQPVPSGPSTAATLTVTATSTGSILPAFAGLSYEKVEMCHPLFSSSNADLIGLFKLLGPSLLRIGGDSSDMLTWMPNGAGQTYGQIAQSDVTAFAGFVKATGWQCLYTVNLGGSALANGSAGYTTPALAAAEVAYLASQLGSSLYGIEIGNEPDAYGNAGSYYANANPAWSLAAYEPLWNQYRSAILAVTPGAVITGPAGGHLAAWTIPFSETETKAEVSLVTDHYYKLSGQSSTAPTIGQLIAYPDPTLISNLELLATAQASTGIPYRISETNSVTGGFPGVTDSYASSLWAIDHLFTCAMGGATGVNFHGGGTANYAPIEDNEDVVTSVQNEFYGLLLFTLAGSGTIYATQLAGIGSLNVSAYAVKTSNGLSVVLVNKDPNANLNVAVTLPSSATTASLLAMTQLSSRGSGPVLSATSGVSIQGATVSLSGSFSPGAPYSLEVSGKSFGCYVPALSAVLIQST
jgi:hypothetical protein